jgi:two-component system, OmpR family, sensor kinase
MSVPAGRAGPLDSADGRVTTAAPAAVPPPRGRSLQASDLHPYLPVLIVIALAGVGLLAFQQVSRYNDERRFQNATEIVRDAIDARVAAYVSALLATRSFFATQRDMDALTFRNYVSGLAIGERYPGIQGIGFSRRVALDEVAAFEARLSREHGQPFRLWPGGVREELHSIAYLEPLERRNLAALGYDMFSEPVRREAMSRARDTGLPAASGRVTLVQEIDPQKQAGFLIYVPVYRGGDPGDTAARREALLGFVYSPFRMGDLMRGIFGTQREPRVEFNVWDGTEASPASLLYAGIASPVDSAERVPLTVAGRTWLLEVQATPAFMAASGSRLLPHLLAAAVVAVFGVWLLARAQARARNEERAARHEAEQAVRVREEFLAIAGHELKTPLAALQLQVEGLRRQVEKDAFRDAPARLALRLAKAEALVRRLETLIGNLLDVSRIASGRLALDLEEVDAGALLHEVLERFEEPLRRAGCAVQLEIEGPLRGRWDRVRLDQVFTNLLGNALKYGAGRPIAIRAGRRGSEARVATRDHGIGIGPEDAERIFGRFERAVSVRHYGGLGLGLWISQQVVRSLGGRIELESQVGAGSTFTVVLPLEPAS